MIMAQSPPPKPYFNSKGEVLAFSELMHLERIDKQNFRTTAKAYEPTGGKNGAYGGFIFSAAAWAASQTVPDGMIIHSSSGNFILGGQPSEVFDIQVQATGEGRSFCVRNVVVTQSKGICFTCICSFKNAEASNVDVQHHLNINETYKSVLVGKSPFDHVESPTQDSPWFHRDYLPTHPEHYNPLPGLHLRKVDMAAYNKTRKPLDRRQLTFYSARGTLPQVSGSSLTRQANLHAICHLFASDRNSLFLVPRMLDLEENFTRVASLSHIVIFHVGIEHLAMPDEPRGRHAASPPTEPIREEDWSHPADESQRKWFVQESWTTRSAGGRALHTSRLWDPDNGVHLATTMQDGLVRYAPGTELRL